MSAVGSVTNTNPFADAGGRSSYCKWRENTVIGALESPQTLPTEAVAAHLQFRRHILQTDFSCVGAKAAINGNCYRFAFYDRMNTPETTEVLAHDLWRFVREQSTFNSDYATFAASFAAPLEFDEEGWEANLWTQLQSLHDLDRRFHSWDSRVSSDPDSAQFSFSFAKTGFFIVGLHANSSRVARRFQFPTLIFNQHAQFERLRAANKFDRMRQTIRRREMNLQGSLNPNLSNFGEHSEARQYSGRAVEKNWRCPFHALLNKLGK